MLQILLHKNVMIRDERESNTALGFIEGGETANFMLYRLEFSDKILLSISLLLFVVF